MATAAIVTIGNEIVSGDVENTNASWLARRLEALGLKVVLTAAVRDEIDAISELLRAQSAAVGVVVVTGGLGGTPDDITREALAATFEVDQVEQPAVAASLRERFTKDPEYAARWALLPAGARVLENPLGGAPGFVIDNVWVLPGLPSEMRAMFDSVADEVRFGDAIGSWRRTYRTTESRIVAVLETCCEQHPAVAVGSYPMFAPDGSTVEIVLKSTDPGALDAAARWMESALEDVVS